MSAAWAHSLEPVWRAGSLLSSRDCTPELADWLLDTGSLTQRLQCACKGRFRVQVLRHRRLLPENCERAALDMKPRSVALVREVYLLCDDRPWVFARSVIPQTTLQGHNRRYAYLGERPLGAMLFADRTMRRSPIEVAQITSGHGLYRAATKGLAEPPRNFWGRRSVFTVSERPLLVSEFFLPGDLLACRHWGHRG